MQRRTSKSPIPPPGGRGLPPQTPRQAAGPKQPRQMRFSGKEYALKAWKLLMRTQFGTINKDETPDGGASDPNGITEEAGEFELSRDDVPIYYCDRCDREVEGDTRKIDDAPSRCPRCGSPPGDQAIVVIYAKGTKRKRVLPFFLPREQLGPAVQTFDPQTGAPIEGPKVDGPTGVSPRPGV